jgi:hypothetical protein
MESEFDKLMSGSPQQSKEDEKLIEYYATPAHVRQLDFVQPNGEREFISYTLLTNCKINADRTSIELFYSNGQQVKLGGRNMFELYKKLVHHQVKQIVVLDKRYVETKGEREIIVFEIRFNTK